MSQLWIQSWPRDCVYACLNAAVTSRNILLLENRSCLFLVFLTSYSDCLLLKVAPLEGNQLSEGGCSVGAAAHLQGGAQEAIEIGEKHLPSQIASSTQPLSTKDS